ncbi:group II intron reverse transcriptase/maturase [Streptomyces scopuliridis]|uniref:Group II intron reverse transcriptase/maturase n=2 Tax=Streptomyces scopuliridis TaxID=452529 RepID=A0ACD4ZJS7_9ACTN|nr:group II intron reverse transcriptase/maturase [Streptomyces scopuliridis]WSB34009.1 group II intron reverse transcriptase/maturase [Streptomyces scopuliridis]WSB98291.1 group II intron reverse transcriptase/maturase [Streptomyces scopuliridis]WSC00022.1 group II intron reverse transcriptase/maturase [Streptomyces scopuliridis]WSC06280.1 group II intron reverse transcriptase/maturase [Streptomyces scopuliridis]WSC08007.1 group II intron reverse transcriptase/maturase [Streptomyces scopuliri
MSQLKSQAKPFEISKWEVKEAWEEVRANKGAPGVDGQSIADFEKDLKNNLFKVWNRMSSGSYFPPPVRAVAIPKPHGGGERILGIPAVADRVAQTVVARHLVRRVDPIFHPDSFGYRPGRSALDAVEKCRERSWKRDWVVEFDISQFFDSVPWDLLVKAVEAHTDAVWVKLYVRRWLAAPLKMPDGTLLERKYGTPQGAPVSPVLANLFLHYAFDVWMAREFPAVSFERYADDAVVHCVTERQARQVLAALSDRMAEVGLCLHPTKTRIVYCRDGLRRGSYEHTSFTFLGFTFQQRQMRDKNGRIRWSFRPAISNDALKRLGEEVRSWRLHRRVNLTVEELAQRINPIVAGWMQYYGRFYRSAMYPLLMRINAYLVRWLRNKYKRFRATRKAIAALQRVAKRRPGMFAQWRWTSSPSLAW